MFTRGWEQGVVAPLGGDFVWTSPAALLHPGFNTAIFYPPQGLARGYQVMSLKEMCLTCFEKTFFSLHQGVVRPQGLWVVDRRM